VKVPSPEELDVLTGEDPVGAAVPEEWEDCGVSETVVAAIDATPDDRLDAVGFGSGARTAIR
jgi:hypothetical protein